MSCPDGFSLLEASQMLSAFEAVNVLSYSLSLVRGDKEVAGFRSVVSLHRRLVPLFQRAQFEQASIIIRPRGAEVYLVQLDDLSEQRARTLRRFAFMQVETSPGSHQVWLAVDGGTKELARRLKRGIGSDPGASGAVRLAGSRNFKRCHAPTFPMVRVVWSDIKHPFIDAAVLETSALLAEPLEPLKALSKVIVSRPPNAWPDYERCIDGAPETEHGGPDYSRADFTWCLIALQKFRWIAKPQAVAEKLAGLSPKAHGRGDGGEYCRMTVQAAVTVVCERLKRSGSLRV